jgi:hypothetical protein
MEYDDIAAGLGIFRVRKDSIIFNGDMDVDFNLKEYNAKDLLGFKAYEANNIIIVDKKRSNYKKVNKVIEDSRQFEYETVMLELPEDFDPKTEVLIFNLTH